MIFGCFSDPMYTTCFLADTHFLNYFGIRWYTLVYMRAFFHVYHFFQADMCFFKVVYMVYMKNAILYENIYFAVYHTRYHCTIFFSFRKLMYTMYTHNEK